MKPAFSGIYFVFFQPPESNLSWVVCLSQNDMEGRLAPFSFMGFALGNHRFAGCGLIVPSSAMIMFI